ncbi:MAG: polyprenyl synthetase family protein [Planctomycetaceae bacterium]|nr:polyprenyl synthetase family protein [Planctomycetaceae bacterium]
MDRLLAYMKEMAATAEKRLELLLPYADLRPENLHEAMRYSVLGGGKRLRPLLTMAAFEAAGGQESERPRALDAGCAVELLHCYSLVHDDLPAMDNDSMRRNRLTTHKAFGETTAILVGDALQALAFKVLAESAGPRAGRAVVELANAAGSTGMVGGQMLDFEGEGKQQVLEDIERIDRWKTGALFTVCCRLGAIMAGADDTALASLTEYGNAIGLLYQISDDIMDLTATAEKLGKTPGKDKVVGKLTYPAALGVDGARTAVMEKSVQAKDAILGFDKQALYLRLLADYLLDRIS